MLPVAALLLASCGTYPAGDPYGSPYPPQDPYGDPAPLPPYPPQPYPPYPQPYPPTGAYPPGGADHCPVIASRDWRAWINAMPGPDARPTLHVTGTVTVPTAGYRIEFDPQIVELRSYPVQLIVTMRAIPPFGGAAQVVTNHPVRWQWPASGAPVGSLTIRCGDRELARISPVETAH